MKIIFARHGETVFAKEDKFSGFVDSPLTDKGWEQARKVGEFCRENKIEKIISSPFGRARATAEEVGKPCQVKVEFSDILKEICYGEWDGKPKVELQKLDVWNERERDLFRFVHPGSFEGHRGESYEILFHRLEPFFQQLTQGNKNVAIVSHQGIIRCAKKYFDGSFENATPPHDSIYVVELDGNKIRTSSYLV